MKRQARQEGFQIQNNPNWTNPPSCRAFFEFGSMVAVLVACGTSADEHSCPGDRPYPQGESACDSCDARDLLLRYDRGELSETRASAVFDHENGVTVFCDSGRPVDV